MRRGFFMIAFVMCFLLGVSAWCYAEEVPSGAPGEETGGGTGAEETGAAEPAAQESEPDLAQLAGGMSMFERWLSRPLCGRYLNGLNSIVLVPRLQAAESIGRGWLNLELGFSFAKNDFDDADGTDSVDMDAQFREMRLCARYGIGDDWEVSLELPISTWDGDLAAFSDGERIFTGGGPTADISDGVGDPVIEGKYRFWQSASGATSAAAVLDVKMATGDENDYLSTGGWDFALSGLVTHRMEPWSFYGRLGYTFVGSEDAFRNAADVDMENIFSLGVGAAYEVSSRCAILADTNYHTNAFEEVGDVEGFEDAPWNLRLGARWFPPIGDVEFPMGIELGLSLGLNDSSSEWGLFFGVSKAF